jgi:hypothetical protein
VLEVVPDVYEHHISRNVQLFVKVRDIIDKKRICSVEELLSVIEELEECEKVIRGLREQVIDASYDNIILRLIGPLDKLFEEEYK